MLVIKAILDFLRDKNYRDLLLTTSVVILIGTVAFMILEGWRWIDALYFCIITLTTVGYGDFTPQTDAGKLFNIIYLLFGLGLILSFVKTVYDHFENTKNQRAKDKNTKH